MLLDASVFCMTTSAAVSHRASRTLPPSPEQTCSSDNGVHFCVCRWGIVFTMLVPAMGSIIWYGVIPVGSTRGDVGDKALWCFCINPVSMTFLSFLLMSLFFTALDENSPHRPFFCYAHILLANFIAQVCTLLVAHAFPSFTASNEPCVMPTLGAPML